MIIANDAQKVFLIDKTWEKTIIIYLYQEVTFLYSECYIFNTISVFHQVISYLCSRKSTDYTVVQNVVLKIIKYKKLQCSFISLTFITRIQGRGEDINNLQEIENIAQQTLYMAFLKQIKLARLENA